MGSWIENHLPAALFSLASALIISIVSLVKWLVGREVQRQDKAFNVHGERIAKLESDALRRAEHAACEAKRDAIECRQRTEHEALEARIRVERDALEARLRILESDHVSRKDFDELRMSLTASIANASERTEGKLDLVLKHLLGMTKS